MKQYASWKISLKFWTTFWLDDQGKFVVKGPGLGAIFQKVDFLSCKELRYWFDWEIAIASKKTKQNKTKQNKNKKKLQYFENVFPSVHFNIPLTYESINLASLNSPIDDLERYRARKIRFSGSRKSVFLKASSGERCPSRYFVLLVTLGGTRVDFIVYLAMPQMKKIMERQCWNKLT